MHWNLDSAAQSAFPNTQIRCKLARTSEDTRRQSGATVTPEMGFFLDVDDVMNNCVYKQGHRAFEHSRHELETQQTRRGIENRMKSCCTCP